MPLVHLNNLLASAFQNILSKKINSIPFKHHQINLQQYERNKFRGEDYEQSLENICSDWEQRSKQFLDLEPCTLLIELPELAK